jgi:hypothetical protein
VQEGRRVVGSCQRKMDIWGGVVVGGGGEIIKMELSRGT